VLAFRARGSHNPIDIPDLAARGVPSMRYSDDDDDRYDRYAGDDNPRDRRPRRRKRPRQHSELGIASCFIAAMSGTAILVTVVAPAVIMGAHGDMSDSQTAAAGCITLTGGGLAFIGVVVGLIGVLQQRRKKLLAGIGLGFNSCIVLGVGTL